MAAIDPRTRRLVGKAATGRNPVQVYATPDGRHLYVANQGTAKDPDNTVSVIAVDGLQTVATITAGRGAHGVVVSDDGARAFISNIADNSVTVIDTASLKAVDTYKVGKGPNGITYRAAR